ncbi:MAG: hypothetical protein JXR65_03880 [Bacteroidales bacterium]|nr:hypothetical protein [Bacteroidales bacterium]
MKKLFIFLACLPLLVNGQTMLSKWATQPVLKTPESVLYVPKSHQVFVSNINGDPFAKDGNGFISLLSSNGEIINLKWATGLNAPKGIYISGNYLYVSDIDRVAKIDLKHPDKIQFFPASGAKFLNDLVADDKGNVYITDSGLGALYKLEKSVAKIWIQSPLLAGANGLAMENGKILLGANDHLLQIDPETKSVKTLVDNPGGIDGLVPLGDQKYLVSDWAGKIQIISPGKEPVVVSNTTDEKINAADLGYIPEQHLVLIPTFFNNRVVAKELILAH